MSFFSRPYPDHKYVLVPLGFNYQGGRGFLSPALAAHEEAFLPGMFFFDKQSAQEAVDELNEWLNDHDLLEGNEMQWLHFQVDHARPRHRRLHDRQASAISSYSLAKKCLLVDDYAERRLPRILGHNKRPDLTIFMFQMAQRFPKLQVKMLEQRG